MNVVSSASDRGLAYALFKAFLFRYLERFFCLDESSFLFKAFRLFHLLLEFFDPQLANYLHDLDYCPELYSPQWFLTLYARSLPVPQVLRLWDMMIAVDDPAFNFFIGLRMICSQRERILLSDPLSIPEIISDIHFANEEDIDLTVSEALKLYKVAPRGILRNLRLCCISTTELTPSPKLPLLNCTGPTFTTQLQQMRLNMEEHDKRLALQTARHCMTITAQELVESMLSSPNAAESDTVGHVAPQFVIIDIRSYEDSNLTGGGILPRAVQLEPEFLNQPDAFEVWIQHFDGTRGCNICILDLPPAQFTGVALWRRLLLGEGDGTSHHGYLNRMDSDDNRENLRRLEALLAGKRFSTDGRGISTLFTKSLNEDVQSSYFKEENAVRSADLNRPAVLLAIALQTHCFPNVCVLEGGFPALVDQLQSSRGTVEPVIINHDADKWREFVRTTGRLAENQQANSKNKKSVNAPPASLSPPPVPESEMTEFKRLEIALAVAERLQHRYMVEILKEKIRIVEEEQKCVKVV